MNDLYLTLIIRPLAGRAGIAERLLNMVGAGSLPSGNIGAEIRLLNQARDTLLAALEAYSPELLAAYDLPNGLASQPAEFLATLVNGTTAPMLLPVGDLGRAVPRRRLSFGADAIEFGAIDGEPASFAAILSVKDYPAQTSAGMFDDLYRLPFEMTVTQSFAVVDRGPGLSGWIWRCGGCDRLMTLLFRCAPNWLRPRMMLRPGAPSLANIT